MLQDVACGCSAPSRPCRRKLPRHQRTFRQAGQRAKTATPPGIPAHPAPLPSGCRASGVKRIRVHDIRHRHVSLLIDMGFSAVAIAARVGHESIDITYRYAHLFPSKQAEMANKLDDERMVNLNVG